MKSWSPEFESHLLSTSDYREFLSAFFTKDREWHHPRPLSFQEFATRSGFASKSFLSDVIAGRKRLTPNSMNRVIQGLKLPKPWADYFHCLVAQDVELFQSPRMDSNHFKQRALTLKEKLKKNAKGTKCLPSSPVVQVFLEPDFPETFAALGDVSRGETLRNIVARTRIPGPRTEAILQKMMETGLVENRGERYFPLTEALDLEELRSLEVFKSDYFRALEKAKKRFDKQASSKDALFMTQTFSVHSKDLSRFRSELAGLISTFAADSESSNGDCIAEICVGFTNSKDDRL